MGGNADETRLVVIDIVEAGWMVEGGLSYIGVWLKFSSDCTTHVFIERGRKGRTVQLLGKKRREQLQW